MDDEGVGIALKPQRKGFADSGLRLTQATPVGLAALDPVDADVPGVVGGVVFVNRGVVLSSAHSLECAQVVPGRGVGRCPLPAMSSRPLTGSDP